ncbi:MAG: methyltransferase domain-containing protein [Candidatus Omnitrophica bacterium]|nr:methyltransferase domain-containing protein [Candidatus Omnitrophota bacterium]
MPYINGKTIDFGCGVGEFLKILPPDSIGFEINEATVQPYKPEIDRYQFKDIKKGEFNVFTMVHVLEHCADAEKILSIIFTSCARLDIKRIIIVVPGKKGFMSDRTHETFVDFQSFKKALTESKTNYVISAKRYFPFNRALIGNFFVHHELMVIFDKNNG